MGRNSRLRWRRTPTWRSTRARRARRAVGFALETNDLLENAGRKLEKKGFDLLVANDATEEGAGFGVPTNRVTILDREGGTEALPLLSKEEVAERLLDRIEARLERPEGPVAEEGGPDGGGTGG